MGFSQQNVIEVKLVSSATGHPNVNTPPNNTSFSNDSGLNTILQNHNAINYIGKFGHLYTPLNNRFTEVWCNECNPTQLLNDLIAYTNVVENARITGNQSPFSDCLYSQINTLGIGIPIGFNNEIVVTNDDALNQIFEDFNVYFCEQSFPTAISNALQRYYSIVCNCDNTQLKIALDNYDNIINYTEFASVIYLLNNTTFEKPNSIIAPNPFSNAFNIQTEESIFNYVLFDSIGKQIINTNSKSELDVITSQLNQGIYILNLQFENGKKSSNKVVKK